jgi:hypothetical protein
MAGIGCYIGSDVTTSMTRSFGARSNRMSLAPSSASGLASSNQVTTKLSSKDSTAAVVVPLPPAPSISSVQQSISEVAQNDIAQSNGHFNQLAEFLSSDAPSSLTSSTPSIAAIPLPVQVPVPIAAVASSLVSRSSVSHEGGRGSPTQRAFEDVYSMFNTSPAQRPIHQQLSSRPSFAAPNLSVGVPSLSFASSTNGDSTSAVAASVSRRSSAASSLSRPFNTKPLTAELDARAAAASSIGIVPSLGVNDSMIINAPHSSSSSTPSLLSSTASNNDQPSGGMVSTTVTNGASFAVFADPTTSIANDSVPAPVPSFTIFKDPTEAISLVASSPLSPSSLSASNEVLSEPKSPIANENNNNVTSSLQLQYRAFPLLTPISEGSREDDSSTSSSSGNSSIPSTAAINRAHQLASLTPAPVLSFATTPAPLPSPLAPSTITPLPPHQQHQQEQEVETSEVILASSPDIIDVHDASLRNGWLHNVPDLGSLPGLHVSADAIQCEVSSLISGAEVAIDIDNHTYQMESVRQQFQLSDG